MCPETIRLPITLRSPVSGQVLPLEEVGDDVFSRKLLGDGAAVLPSDGTICAPVDGIVGSIFSGGHAYTFTSPEGLEILVHVGLETVALEGAPFRCFVSQGEAVKAGQVIAQADLDLIQRRGARTVTMLVVCEGAEECTMTKSSGCVVAGQDVLLTLN